MRGKLPSMPAHFCKTQPRDPVFGFAAARILELCGSKASRAELKQCCSISSIGSFTMPIVSRCVAIRCAKTKVKLIHRAHSHEGSVANEHSFRFVIHPEQGAWEHAMDFAQ